MKQKFNVYLLLFLFSIVTIGPKEASSAEYANYRCKSTKSKSFSVLELQFFMTRLENAKIVMKNGKVLKIDRVSNSNVSIHLSTFFGTTSELGATHSIAIMGDGLNEATVISDFPDRVEVSRFRCSRL